MPQFFVCGCVVTSPKRGKIQFRLQNRIFNQQHLSIPTTTSQVLDLIIPQHTAKWNISTRNKVDKIGMINCMYHMKHPMANLNTHRYIQCIFEDGTILCSSLNSGGVSWKRLELEPGEKLVLMDSITTGENRVHELFSVKPDGTLWIWKNNQPMAEYENYQRDSLPTPFITYGRYTLDSKFMLRYEGNEIGYVEGFYNGEYVKESDGKYHLYKYNTTLIAQFLSLEHSSCESVEHEKKLEKILPLEQWNEKVTEKCM